MSAEHRLHTALLLAAAWGWGCADRIADRERGARAGDANGGSGGALGSGGAGASLGAPGSGGSGDAGGSGGSAGGSGAGGSGGASCPAPGSTLIDDLEREVLWSYWYTAHDTTPGGRQVPDGAVSPEASSNGGFAVHTYGDGFSEWGAAMGIHVAELQACFDWHRSRGIRFRARGQGSIGVAAAVRGVLPVSEGGSCSAEDQAESRCYDYHHRELTLSSSWQTHEIEWGALQQAGWGTPVSFQAGDVVSIEFTIAPEQMPFDFWIDELSLVAGTSGSGGSSGGGGSGGIGGGSGGTGGGSWGSGGSGGTGGGSTGLAEVLSSASFDRMFPDRAAFYAYSGLLSAAAAFPDFANGGALATRQREVAAFLANVARETGELRYVNELNPAGDYCDMSPVFSDHACAPGKRYFGRGPMQISWNYNYGRAGEFLGLPLLQTPELVAEDPDVAWRTALWYWMLAAPQGTTAHEAMERALGFGATIRIINGLECDGGWPAAVAERVQHYLDYCSLLGVSPGAGDLEC